MNVRIGALAIVVTAAVAAVGLVAAVEVPAASARSGGQVKLSVLPLPKSALGPAAQRLRLEHDSGVVHDFGYGLPLTPNHSWGRRGYVGGRSGYALDYGLGASGGAGVTEVWTGIDQYQTSADATDALSVWKGYDKRVSRYDCGGLAVAIKAEEVAPVGSRRFAFLVRYRAANIAPLFGFDEQFTQGRYEADVTVWAGRAATAEKLAPKLAAKLEARIKLALAGRLHAKPVKLPARQKTGPPTGGPDLAPLALTAGGYLISEGPFPLSFYLDSITSKVGEGFQRIEWFATANEASFVSDFRFSEALWGLYGPGYPPPVDLSSIGDGAEGVLSSGSGGGYGELVFSSGQLAEFVFFASSSAISTSDVQSLAQTVADKINAAGLGS